MHILDEQKLIIMARHRITENGHMMWFDSDEEYHAHLQKQEDIRRQQEEAEEAELVEKIKKIAVFVITLVVFVAICLVWRAIDNLGKPKEQTFKKVEKEIQPQSVISQSKQGKTNTQIVNEVETEIVVEYSHDLEDMIEEYEDLDANNSVADSYGLGLGENDEIELEESLEHDYSRQKIYQSVEVDEEPKFPGGEHKLMEYIADKTVYPQTAIDEGIQGRVFVSFVVEPNGKVTNVEALRGIGGGCDEEAVRVVKSLPNWEPGIKRGKNVRVAIVVPVKFALE